VLRKNDVQSQRHVAKSEFLQNNKVVSRIGVAINAGMKSFQWNMEGPAPPPNPNRDAVRVGATLLPSWRPTIRMRLG
jgi:hypothetical protein